jgi:hypothetical protein
MDHFNLPNPIETNSPITTTQSSNMTSLINSVNNKSPHNTESWDKLSSFEQDIKPDILNDQQEQVGLDQPITRSQSDFSRWLQETMIHARGDGTSTVHFYILSPIDKLLNKLTLLVSSYY